MSGTLAGLIRGAAAVNVRYTASLVGLARDYVEALSETLSQGPREAAPANGARPTSAPLLLAGRAKETVNAAFTIGGGPNLPATLTLSVRGDFGDTKVWVEPGTLSLRDGKAAITRIMATIGAKTAADTDVAGEVMIEELNRKLTDFVVHKLPDA